jgi:hypothetical protein
MKALACVLALACGCDWATRHPAPTAAITGGAIALGTCEIQGASQAACGVVSASAAALLGVTAAVVMWIVGDQPAEDQTVDPTLLVPDEERPVHVPTKTELPPKLEEPPAVPGDAAPSPPPAEPPTTPANPFPPVPPPSTTPPPPPAGT